MTEHSTGEGLASDVLRIDRVETALRRWLEQTGLASYDPYDGLSCTAPWSLVRRNGILARLWMQAIRRSPVNVRPLFGIRPRVLVKSLADVATAALLRHRLGRDPNARATARGFLDQLRAESRPGFSGACWALENPYRSRFVDSGPNTPNLFWTLNAGTAFLEAYELDGHASDLAIARSAVDFILGDLGYQDEGDGGIWFRYFAGHDAVVYNVTALAGAYLLRVARWTNEPEIAQLGARALRFVVIHQNPDGSWFYARSPQGRWIDGFHTGYVLESLLQAFRMHERDDVGEALRKGFAFYRARMFTTDHVPRYTSDALYPIDVQNCAQAIQTLAQHASIDSTSLEIAIRTAVAVERMLFRRIETEPQESGYFVLKRHRWWTDRMPAVRWGQAPMLLALTHLQTAHAGLWPAVRHHPPDPV